MGACPFQNHLVTLLIEKVGALNVEFAVNRRPSVYNLCIGKSNEGKKQQ